MTPFAQMTDAEKERYARAVYIGVYWTDLLDDAFRQGVDRSARERAEKYVSAFDRQWSCQAEREAQVVYRAHLFRMEIVEAELPNEVARAMNGESFPRTQVVRRLEAIAARLGAAGTGRAA